jgi:hypothetical protein
MAIERAVPVRNGEEVALRMQDLTTGGNRRKGSHKMSVTERSILCSASTTNRCRSESWLDDYRDYANSSGDPDLSVEGICARWA